MTLGRGRPRVILLPGAVLPAELAYQNLLRELGNEVDARLKDLEVYAAADCPPANFSLDTEVRGVIRLADEARFDRFHLVGYSAGGAVSLALTSAYPDRVLSLALLEPAWAGNEGLSPQELEAGRTLRTLLGLPSSEFMAAFVRYQLKPGVKPPSPPDGQPPSWMALRPAGIRALIDAFANAVLDIARLRKFERPVYFALGALSNPDHYGRMAERLGGIFPNFKLENYPERHHFDPPHRFEPARLAMTLRRHWLRADP